MKKITLFFMACMMSVMAFAAGGNITYVLNGGVTNDDGWTSKSDMLVAFSDDYNTKFAKATAWGASTTAGQIVATTYPSMYALFEDETLGVKWAWLKTYILKVATDQVSIYNYLTPTGLQDGYDPRWRAAVDGFFTNSQYAAGAYNGGPDFTSAGQSAAFYPTWNHGFAGPATYDGSVAVVIPDPYKAEATFDGWYATSDFSGAKVTSIPAGADGDQTLYAKWIEYVPTCAEVWALTSGATTKASGVVTYVNGTTVYVQDASAGLQIEFAATPAVVAGDKITVTGTTAGNGKITGATLSGTETAALPSAQTVTLAALAAGAAPYSYELVYLDGLTITAIDATKATLSDGTNTIELRAALNLTDYKVNTKVNVKAVVAYDVATTILVAPTDFISKAPLAGKDPAVYPVLQDKYTLTNKWLISNNLDNFSANRVGSPNYVRAMTAQNGKFYFPDREHRQLIVVDGETGEQLAPIALASNIFRYTPEGGTEKDAGTLIFNDIKQDAAGHILVGNCITSNAELFQVWKIDLATGNGTLIVSEILNANPDYATTTVRFDAFGVYGDVDGNAIIMASNASGMNAFKWTITNGVADPAEKIDIDVSEDGTFLLGLANPGSAPQIFPVDENYFYLDGNSTHPTLINMDGAIVDGFFNVPAEVEVWDATHFISTNGLAEFDLGGEYFFIMAYANTDETPASSFRLFKFKDANKEFADIESLWTLPEVGMGAVSNAYRTVMPVVEVNEATKTATIYLYAGENGYGVYELKLGDGSGINTIANEVVAVSVSGKTIQLSEPVASIKAFNLIGQLVASDQGVSSITVANSGVYVVTLQTTTGVTVTKKVLVK